MAKIDVHIHITLDRNMDGYVKSMDRFGIEMALLHALPRYVARCGNEAVARVVRRHRGRLIGSVHVDLRRPIKENMRLARKYAQLGFKSIKLFPNLGFDPNDEKHEPFWQAVEDLGLVVLAHCGWLGPDMERPKTRLHSLTASPFHFEVPARRHPRINFIFAHFGGGATYLETVVLLSRLPNCFADVCPGWGKWIWENRMPGLKGLDRCKVMYGTDSMGENYGKDIRFWTQTLRSYGYTDKDLEKFFHGNAARVLNLK